VSMSYDEVRDAMTNEKGTFNNAFWHGCASVLSVFPVHRQTTKRFTFRGVDLLKVSAADALKQDWRMVGSAITSALQQMDEPENERRRALLKSTC